MNGVGEIVGQRRPEYGPDVYDLACDCGATWSGGPGTPCPWCVAAAERQRHEQRRLLLFPPWLRDGGPRYDELAEIDRRIWDATRGQTRDADSLRAWGERLARAVTAGLITADEAEAAIARSERR